MKTKSKISPDEYVHYYKKSILSYKKYVIHWWYIHFKWQRYISVAISALKHCFLSIFLFSLLFSANRMYRIFELFSLVFNCIRYSYCVSFCHQLNQNTGEREWAKEHWCVNGNREGGTDENWNEPSNWVVFIIETCDWKLLIEVHIVGYRLVFGTGLHVTVLMGKIFCAKDGIFVLCIVYSNWAHSHFGNFLKYDVGFRRGKSGIVLRRDLRNTTLV